MFNFLVIIVLLGVTGIYGNNKGPVDSISTRSTKAEGNQ